MDRPKFRINSCGDESTLEWCYRFYRSIEPPGILTRKEDNSLWVTPPTQPPRRVESIEEFRGIIPSFYHIVKVQETRDGNLREQSTVLSREQSILLYHSEAKGILPRLMTHIFEPAVVNNGNDQFKITPPGYDPNSELYYYVPPNEDPISPLEGTAHLEAAFSAVPFEKIEYRNNLFAWLLGGVFFIAANEPPMLAITGNQRGIGKSKTQESCGYLLTGQWPLPIDHTSEEFDKQLGARFREGARFISFDNVVAGAGRAYRNDRLSRMLTQGWSKSVRILGQSRSIEQKGVLFAINSNDCALDADLSSRSLPVKLYREIPGPMAPFVKDYVVNHRTEIYGELLNIALSQVDLMPFDIYPYYRYRTWLSLVLPRIEKFFGPMAIEEINELDDSIIDLYSWGNDQNSDFTFNVNDILEKLRVDAARFMGLYERFATIRSERERYIRIEKFLNYHVGRPYTINRFTLKLKKEDGSEPRYKFERI